MTLVEMVVALAILVITITSMVLVIGNGLRTQAMTERGGQTTGQAQLVMSKARELAFADLGFYTDDYAHFSTPAVTPPANGTPIVLPINSVSAGVVGATLSEVPVNLGATRPYGKTVLTNPVQSFTNHGVDYRVTTTVTWVPNANAATPTAKRVTVVTQWAPSPTTLTGNCAQAKTHCTTQSIVRTASAADLDPVTGTAPSTNCLPTAKVICEAYIRSGRVMDGARMAGGVDTPTQVAPVDLYVRTASPATSVTATWSWKNDNGAITRTVTKPLTAGSDGTRWTATIPPDDTSANATPKGDIRPGQVTVTFNAVISTTSVTATRDAFWSFAVADGDNQVTATLGGTGGTGWCSPAGLATQVQFDVQGHSLGFTAGTQNPSTADSVDVVFTTLSGGVTRTQTVAAALDPASVASQAVVVNGQTVGGWVNASWKATPPPTDTCTTRAVTVLVHRAADQTTTPITLQLPATTPVVPTVAAPTVNLTMTAATGAWTATWNTPASATSFDVETVVAGGSPTVTNQTATGASGTVLAGQTVTVRVKAKTVWSESAWSNLTTATRPPSAAVVSASRTANSATFTWPAVAYATSYWVDLSVDGAAATRTTVTAPTFTTPVQRGSTVSVNVYAVAGTTPSLTFGSSSASNPLWEYPTMANSWVNYASGWSTVRYTKTSAGVVVVEGLVRSGSSLIFNLPPGFRPTDRLIFQQSTEPTTVSRVDVTTTGDVILQTNNGTAGGWLSLSGITFVTADTAITRTPATLVNGWSNYGGGYAALTTGLDAVGRVQVQGLVNAGTLGDGTALANIPAAHTSDQYLHIASMAMDKFSLMGVNASAQIVAKSTTPAGWNSYQAMYYPATKAGVWSNMTLQNGWVRYNGFAAPQYTKAADGIVSLRGLLTGGTTGGAVITTLPVGYRPSATLIFDVANSGHYARVDVGPTGAVTLLEGGDNTWLALESINFVAEQ